MPSPSSSARTTPSSSRRPSLVAKPTQVRLQKHRANQETALPVAPRALDTVIVGLGYASLAGYLYHNARRFSPWEVGSIGAASVALGWGLFGLGKRKGTSPRAGFIIRTKRSGEDDYSDSDEEGWKHQFKGREFENLSVPEKMEWLRLEETRIREMQEDEQLRCGQAYIAKEQAYLAYEKHGGYGGADWKRYAEADTECRDMYKIYEKQRKRLSAIREEIGELQDML